MSITRVQIYECEIPLVTPFTTTVKTLEALPRLIVEIEASDGTVGLGEAAPNVEVTGETGPGTAEILVTDLAPDLLGKDPLRKEKLNHSWSGFDEAPAAVAGIDIALWDLHAKLIGKPLCEVLGGFGDQPHLDIPQVVGMDDPESMASAAETGVENGHRHLKIKVGDDPVTDRERIRRVDEAIPESVTLTADVNQGWVDAKGSKRILADVGDALDVVEQPVSAAAVGELETLRRRTRVPIMADECIRTPADMLDLVCRGCADQYNVKLMKSGGISRSLQMIHIAEAADRPVKIGSMIEAGIGTAAGLHLAQALPAVTANDLAGPLLLDSHLTDLVVEHGTIKTDGPGLGVTINRSQLATHCESTTTIE